MDDKGPPRLVVFDAIETLFSLDPVRDVLGEAGLSASALDVWFARLLRDAFALTAAGGYAPFSDLAEGALATVLADEGIDPTGVAEEVFAAFTRLPAHEDARPALKHVDERGIPIRVLTNGTRETTTKVLEHNGLAALVEGVVTVHDSHRWKPAPESYLAALADTDVEPGDAALVAVHGWDICGARRAGLRTGWCSRLEHELSPVLGPADVTGATLVDVVAALVPT